MTIMKVLLFALGISIKLMYFLRAVNGHNAAHTNWVKLENASTIACQGESAILQCPNYEGVFIVDAFWGREDNITCQPNELNPTCSHTEMCIPKDREADDKRVNEECHTEQWCTVIASNLFFRFDQDICPEVCKYLQINYHCKQMSGMKKMLIQRQE